MRQNHLWCSLTWNSTSSSLTRSCCLRDRNDGMDAHVREELIGSESQLQNRLLDC